MFYGELIDIDSDSVKKFKSATEQCDEFIQNIDKLEKNKEKTCVELSSQQEMLKFPNEKNNSLRNKFEITENRLKMQYLL